MKNTLFSFLVLMLLSVTWTGCKFNINEGLSWDSDLLAPIAQSTVTISDALEDSSILAPGSDNFLSLVFRDTLSTASIDDIIELPDTTLEFSLTLDSLSLDPGKIEEVVSLGEIALQLKSQGNIVGDLILAAAGSTTPFPVPDIDNLSSGSIPVDASDFFEYAEILSGSLKLTIENQLPLDIANVRFQIENASGPPPIINDTFPLIRSESSITETYDMAGKTIESALTAALANLDIKGKTVVIDTSKYIKITLEAVNLKVSSAIAIFPGQTIFDSLAKTEYIFPPEYGDIELTKLVVKSGKIRARTFSTIEDTLLFTYRLPSAERDGEVPEVKVKVNPAINGIPDVQEIEEDLSGFTMDLTLDGTTYNTLLQQYTVDLVYSGKKVEIDRTDSLYVSFGLVEIEPTYVEGYLGKQKFTFEGQEAIDLFDMLDVDRLEVVNPIGNITLANSFGAEHRAVIRHLTARNSKTGKVVPLAGEPTRSNSGILMPAPAFGDTFGVAYNQIQFSGENGNLDDFFNARPDIITYDLEVDANYNGQPGVHTNFATRESKIEGFVEFLLPLEGVVERLRMSDSVELEFDAVTNEEIERVNGGLLRLKIFNQFPLEGIFSVYLYDRNYVRLEVLAEDHTLEAGIPDPQSGYVDTPGLTILEKSFTQESLRKVLDESAYVSFHYVLNTRPEDTAVKIYYDYTVKAQLIGEFNYRFDQ